MGVYGDACPEASKAVKVLKTGVKLQSARVAGKRKMEVIPSTKSHAGVYETTQDGGGPLYKDLRGDQTRAGGTRDKA